jgi:hypothetical protein
MGQWLTDVEKWATDHGPIIALVGVAATVVGITLGDTIATGVKAIGSAFLWLWEHRPRRSKNKLAAGRADLFFVPIPHRCFFAVLQDAAGHLNAEIHIRLHATNASVSKMPVKLLRARLSKPRLAEPVVPEFIMVEDSPPGSNYDTLPAGQTRHVTIRIYVPLSSKPTRPIVAQIVVTDQLGNEYTLPKLTLRNMTPEPAANPRVPPNQAKSPSITKAFKVRVQLPSDLWEVIVEFSGEMVKGNTEQRLRQLAGEAAIEVLNRRWDQLNPDGPDLPNFTLPNFARDVMTKLLSEFEVSSIPEDVVWYQLSVDLRAWIINGPA